MRILYICLLLVLLASSSGYWTGRSPKSRCKPVLAEDQHNGPQRAKISRASLKSLILAKRSKPVPDNLEAHSFKISDAVEDKANLPPDEGRRTPLPRRDNRKSESISLDNEEQHHSKLSLENTKVDARSAAVEVSVSESIVSTDDSVDELEALMEEGGKHLPSDIDVYSNRRAARPIADDFRHKDQERVQELIDFRTSAQKSADFITADKIKAQLQDEYEVEVFDSLGIWKGPRGLTGRVGSKSDLLAIPCKITSEEAQALVDSRTKARRSRDFALADSIRVDLTLAGIEVVDRENKWRSFDGSISGMQSADFDTYSSNPRGRSRNESWQRQRQR